MRKTLLAAASAVVLGLGTTAAMAQIHGGHGGGGMGGGHFSGPGGGVHMGAGVGAGAPGAFAGPRANVAAAPNNFAAGNRSFAAGRFNRSAGPNTFAANPAFAGRGRNFASRGGRFDRFHGRRFAFFPGFFGIYDYAGPTCYYDPNAPWTYSYYGYDNCYPYSYSPSYNWD